jgi:hypothetical protein
MPKSHINKKSLSYEKMFEIERVYLYPLYFADISLTSSVKRAIGGNLTETIAEFTKDHVDSYYNVNEINYLGKKIFNRILKDRSYFKIVEKNVLWYGKKLLEFCDKVGRLKLSKLTNKELYEIYHYYAKSIIKMRDWGWVPVVLDGLKKAYLSDYLIEQLKKILKRRGVQNKKISEYYSILTSSEKKVML